jgi:anti-sigma-K factor RskA
MNPDTHALAGAYAVNAVTDEERVSFELHLDQCADCRAEVAELRAAAGMLATNVELPPPPALRASVLSAISQTRQLSPLTGAAAETQRETEPPPPSSPDPDPDPDPHPEPDVAAPDSRESVAPAPADVKHAAPATDELAARRQRRLRPWLAAAAAAAVVTIGGVAWQPWDDSTPTLTATEQVLRSDDAQRLEQPMGSSEVAIVRSPSKKQAVFVADDMPPAPSGKAYQLWLDMPGQGMVSAGMIPTSGSTVAVLLHGDATTATGAGITLEPEGGSTKPTSDPVALFTFA